MAGNKHPRRRRHSGLERLKSLLIVLLTLSALALTLRVLLFNELAGRLVISGKTRKEGPSRIVGSATQQILCRLLP